MREAIEYSGTWKSVRHDWKRIVARSQNLSQGAKYLARILCDEYANFRTGCCWPKNQTLAKLVDKDVRSVQRYIAELKRHRFITEVQMDGQRRALQLVLPAGLGGDSKHDKYADCSMTSPSPNNDMRVAPYKEPRKNINDQAKRARDFSYVLVQRNDGLSFNAWNTWATDVGCLNFEEILVHLEKDGAYCLPCRFPGTDAVHLDHYFDYFSAMGVECEFQRKERSQSSSKRTGCCRRIRPQI